MVQIGGEHSVDIRAHAAVVAEPNAPHHMHIRVSIPDLSHGRAGHTAKIHIQGFAVLHIEQHRFNGRALIAHLDVVEVKCFVQRGQILAEQPEVIIDLSLRAGIHDLLNRVPGETWRFFGVSQVFRNQNSAGEDLAAGILGLYLLFGNRKGIAQIHILQLRHLLEAGDDRQHILLRKAGKIQGRLIRRMAAPVRKSKDHGSGLRRFLGSLRFSSCSLCIGGGSGPARCLYGSRVLSSAAAEQQDQKGKREDQKQSSFHFISP